MKKWILLSILSILVIGIVLMSGCTSTAPAATPTPQVVYVTVLVTPTPTLARAQDPIIGVWRLSNPDSDGRLRFNADGAFALSYSSGGVTKLGGGTWTAIGGNSYGMYEPSTNAYSTYIYDPARNAIYDTRFPLVLYTPYQGDVMTSSPAAVTTNSPSVSQKASYQAKVIYSGGWSGALNSGGSGKTISGTGTRTFDSLSAPIAINAIKADSSSQRLTLEILKNGIVIKSDFTDEPNGMLQIVAMS